jgi:hypothetical protein
MRVTKIRSLVRTRYERDVIEAIGAPDIEVHLLLLDSIYETLRDRQWSSWHMVLTELVERMLFREKNRDV